MKHFWNLLFHFMKHETNTLYYIFVQYICYLTYYNTAIDKDIMQQ